MEHEEKKTRVVIVGGGRMSGRSLQIAAALKGMEAKVISQDEAHSMHGFEMANPEPIIIHAPKRIEEVAHIKHNRRKRGKGKNKNRWG